MKILSLHSDYLEFEPVQKAVKEAEDVDKIRKRVEDCLVIFSSVEKEDENDLEGVAKKTVAEIQDIAKQIKTKRIVIYPWVHLSEEPSSPRFALELLKHEEALLADKGYEVFRAPFGWYKMFTIKCKGHPLAELSRKISGAADTKKKHAVSKALKHEKKLRSDWYILSPDGERSSIGMEAGDVKGFDFSLNPNLKKFAAYEIKKIRAVTKEPPHVKTMKEMELADYEPGSDPGNLRFYPKGRLVKSLLEELVTREIVDYGGMEVESPIMYDVEHPALKAYLHRFPARQYMIETPNKKVFLRFAACFGQFLMANNAVISYKNLPLKLYELTRYSFRVEQRGELTGLRRLRAFTMPDCHALCADMEQAKDEMMVRFELNRKITEMIGFKVPGEMELGVRVTKQFWEKNKDYVIGMVKKWGKPALLEMWDRQFFYYVMKYEFNFVDALDKASALATDQIDVENAKNYDITYTDTHGKKQHPVILHLSPGAIERIIYALLERAHLEYEAGKQPMLPLWVSPVQARVIPISKEHMKFAEKVADEMDDVRIDLDDSNETLSKKIRRAEKEWIPVIIVVGDKEMKSKELSVRIRRGEQKLMTPAQFKKWFNQQMDNMPYRPLSLPKPLSKRPIFVG